MRRSRCSQPSPTSRTWRSRKDVSGVDLLCHQCGDVTNTDKNMISKIIYIYVYTYIYIYCILRKPKKTVSQLCFWKHFTGFMGLSMSLWHNERSLSELHSRIGTSKTCSVKSKSAAPLSCCETVPWNNRYNRSQRKSVVLSRDLSVLAVFQSGNKPQNQPQNQP